MKWKVYAWGDGTCRMGPDDGHGPAVTVRLRTSMTNNTSEMQRFVDRILAAFNHSP